MIEAAEAKCDADTDLRIAVAEGLAKLYSSPACSETEAQVIVDFALRAIAERVCRGDAVTIRHIGTLELVPSRHGSAIAVRFVPAVELLEECHG